MMATEEQIQARIEQIRTKRLEQLAGAWELMCRRYKECREYAFLSDGLAAAVVESYLQDRQDLVHRSNIAGRIQRHKIAGLMAASIVKIKPIQLREQGTRAARISRDNEALAILHGLAVCAEGQIDVVLKFLQLPNFAKWYSDFVYYLVRRSDCADGCSMIFATVSLTHFPGNFAEARL